MSSDAHLSDLYPPAEAAARMRISRATLDRMHARKSGPCRTMIGSKVFYLKSEIEDFIVRRTQKLKQAPAQGDLAALIEQELLERSSPDFDPAYRDLLTAFAGTVAALMRVHENVRDGIYTPDQAQLFVHSIISLAGMLAQLPDDVRVESMAAEILTGACATAATTFPELMAAENNEP